MADVANAFQVLLGAGEVQVSASKKKNKSKSKPSVEPKSEAGVPSSPSSNGHAHEVLDVSEVIAILERAAREARSISDKSKLWKDWVRQGSDRSGRGIKYKAGDGSLLDFKQALLLSKALEISIETSVVSGLAHEHFESLSQLLAVFLPSSGNVPQTLASQLVRLAGLLANEAPDTLGAAQRAVHSVVSALKSAVDHAHGDVDAAAAWLARISEADKGLGKQQGLLQKLASTSGGVVTKDQLSCARAVHKLSEEKFDLLQPDHLPVFKPASGAAEASSKALNELRGVIDNHLTEASALEDSAKGKGSSAESQRVQTMAAYRREETIVSQEAVAVAAQIRTLEAQLRALKSKQAELDERRAQLQQQSRVVSDSAGSSKAGGGRLKASHYRDELAVIQNLNDLLMPGQSSPESIIRVQQSQVHAPREYVVSGQYYLQLAVASLTDLPNKLTFCKQRVSQAEKLLALGAEASHGKKKEEAEKLLAEHMKSAEELMSGCMQVIGDLNLRYEAISRSPDSAGAAEALRDIDALSLQLRAAYDSVQASFRAPLVEVPPPPRPPPGNRGTPPAVASNGRHTSAQDGGKGGKKPGSARAPTRPVSARPVAPPAAALPATVPTDAAPPVVAAVAAPAAPKPTGPPPKQWGIVQSAAPSADEASEPTPAEAAKAAEAADGFKEVSVKKNKKKERE